MRRPVVAMPCSAAARLPERSPASTTARQRGGNSRSSLAIISGKVSPRLIRVPRTVAISPILHEDLLIVAFDGSSSGQNPKVGWQIPWDKAVIVAIDKNTGKVRWEGKRGLSRIAHVTPQIFRDNGIARLISSAARFSSPPAPTRVTRQPRKPHTQSPP